jgi:hypothetical protein
VASQEGLGSMKLVSLLVFIVLPFSSRIHNVIARASDNELELMERIWKEAVGA